MIVNPKRRKRKMNCVMPKIEEKNRKEQIRNQMFRENVKISPVKTKLEHGQIRWLGHIMRRYNNRFIKQIYMMQKK